MIEPQATIRTPNEARVIRPFGDEMVLHSGVEDTGGKFTMWTNITPPGGGAPPHYHDNKDDGQEPVSSQCAVAERATGRPD